MQFYCLNSTAISCHLSKIERVLFSSGVLYHGQLSTGRRLLVRTKYEQMVNSGVNCTIVAANIEYNKSMYFHMYAYYIHT
jgi:hypothetical protein